MQPHTRNPVIQETITCLLHVVPLLGAQSLPDILSHDTSCDRFVNLALGYCVRQDRHPHHDQQEGKEEARQHERIPFQETTATTAVIKVRKREERNFLILVRLRYDNRMLCV